MTAKVGKKDDRTAKDGFVLLAAPVDCTAVTAGGIEYSVVDGVAEVPAAIAAELAPHGFTLVSPASE